VRRTAWVALFVLAMSAPPRPGHGQADGGLPRTDAVRLAEAFRLANSVRATVWPGWERTAMAVLLVTDSLEYLIGHPDPDPEFSPLGRDPVLAREVLSRPRRFPPTLLATFPAVRGRSTIVVGSAERTGKSSAEWVLTLLHEHFHQWQSSLPDYYAGADRLGLARGDTTGRWMLDYPFPYDSAPVRRAVHDMAAAVAGALATPPGRRAESLRSVVGTGDGLRRLLAPDDHRYLEFQLWQEGVPRFVELAVAEAAAAIEQPAAAFRELPDYVPYGDLAARRRQGLGRELTGLELGRDRRVAFYALGAGLALLLEQSGGAWKPQYERHPFALAALVRQHLSP
jgi:hypothetical protein